MILSNFKSLIASTLIKKRSQLNFTYSDKLRFLHWWICCDNLYIPITANNFVTFYSPLWIFDLSPPPRLWYDPPCPCVETTVVRSKVSLLIHLGVALTLSVTVQMAMQFIRAAMFAWAVSKLFSHFCLKEIFSCKTLGHSFLSDYSNYMYPGSLSRHKTNCFHRLV